MQDKHLLATLFKIINVSTFALVSLIWKIKLEGLTSDQQYFLQAIAATITLYLIMIFWKGPSKPPFKVQSIKTYWQRAGCNAIGIPLWMSCLKIIGVNEAMAISYLGPALTCFLAVFLLKERVRLNWIMALILGFSGVLVLLYYRPSSQAPSGDYFKGIILALLASLSFSFYNILCKVQANNKDNAFTQAFYTFGLASLLGLPLALLNWKPITSSEAFWALFSGVIGVLSVITLYLSYCYSSVVKLSPHSYFKLIISALGLYIFEGEVPSWPSLIAIALILLGNSAVLFERQFYLIFQKRGK